MKTIIYFALALILMSCCSKKPFTDLKEVNATQSIQSACPDEGKCTIELVSNKSLNVKADEFGSIYYQLLDADKTSVIRYTYDKDVPEGLQDGNYREEIIFEISNTNQTLVLSGKELQQTKMLFGRFCFCRGQTGSYKVEDGTLNLTKKGAKIEFDLNFTITKVPQLVHSIKATLH